MEQEYIKGDIVMYNNKIHTIMDTLGVNNYKLFYIEHPVHQLELSGVPITPEILKKNEWRKTKESFKTQSYYKKNFGVNVRTIITINGYFRIVYNITHIRYIQYVHELQHWLLETYGQSGLKIMKE